MGAKMGRPKVDKPKEYIHSIRVNEETEHMLQLYCKVKGITKGEAYRKGLELLMKRDPV